MTVIGRWNSLNNPPTIWSDHHIRSRCKEGTAREREAYENAGYLPKSARPAITDLKTLADDVCRSHSMPISILCGRLRSAILARGEFCYRAATELNIANKAIAQFLGDRDPSTISYYVWRYATENNKEVNKLNTHCAHGHEWTEANTYRDPRGNRSCRACRAIWRKGWRKRRNMRGECEQTEDLSTQLATLNERLVASRKRKEYTF